MTLRQEITKFDESKKGKGYSEAKQAYKEFRVKYELTASNHPQILKDALDIFIDTHYSKQFLRKNNLVTEPQRFAIR